MTNRTAKPPAFDSWAAVYDLTDRDPAPFIEFHRSLITDRTRSLLELGCGTGTVTIPLARHLADRDGPTTRSRIVGVDLSPEMLRIARTRDECVEWVLGDMRAPPVEGPFDLVISCFNTVQMLLTDDDLVEALRAVRRLIGNDGTFAFDIYRPNVAYLSKPQANRLARSVTDDHGRRLEVREDTSYDRATQVLSVDWRLVEEGSDDAPPLAKARYQLRQYFPADLERMLARAQLAVRERYGELDRSKFTASSKRQVLVCGSA